MENQKLCEEMSEQDVPEDLWPGILCRLPVKSLLRFRSVSKSWLAIIDDPEFPRLHLKNFSNNGEETHLLAVQNSGRECVLRCSKTFEDQSGTIHTLGRWNIVCSVDGLILLSISVDYIRSSELLWNPSIRKFREVPALPERDASTDACLMYVAIGLGYDTLAKDYKMVKLVFALSANNQSKIPHAVAIFSLGENSWKIIKIEGKGGFDWRWGFKVSSELVYFQGCLYFVAGVRDLVQFELSSEVFSSVSLPNVVYHNHLGEWEHSKCKRLALVDGGCTMAAFFMSPEERSIWVLDTESMNWARRYTFQLECHGIMYLKNNGDILVRRGRTENIAGENAEEPEGVWWDQVGSYSPKTNEYKVLQEEKSPFFIICNAYGFNESLILHK